VRAERAAADREVERVLRRRSRRSFLTGGAAAVAAVAGWRWLSTRRTDDDVPWPLRRALEINEQFARDYFRRSRLAPAFAPSRIEKPRVNGTEGLDNDDFDPAAWKLQIEGLAESDDPVTLTLDQVRSLPRVEMITRLKCIEGWDYVTRWTGARLADLAAKFRPAEETRYVGLETPDGGYYVGLDLASALHPQTLLCYEMNGEPITLEHGAPLRLAIPVKYGVKNLKRIGTIRFTPRRPPDYWAERGYDWYAGL
jgi:DMSO/TMAO reductase YedYZ molybdopterin-dependent catalytic subunit